MGGFKESHSAPDPGATGGKQVLLVFQTWFAEMDLRIDHPRQQSQTIGVNHKQVLCRRIDGYPLKAGQIRGYKKELRPFLSRFVVVPESTEIMGATVVMLPFSIKTSPSRKALSGRRTWA